LILVSRFRQALYERSDIAFCILHFNFFSHGTLIIIFRNNPQANYLVLSKAKEFAE